MIRNIVKIAMALIVLSAILVVFSNNVMADAPPNDFPFPPSGPPSSSSGSDSGSHTGSGGSVGYSNPPQFTLTPTPMPTSTPTPTPTSSPAATSTPGPTITVTPSATPAPGGNNVALWVAGVLVLALVAAAGYLLGRRK